MASHLGMGFGNAWGIRPAIYEAVIGGQSALRRVQSDGVLEKRPSREEEGLEVKGPGEPVDAFLRRCRPGETTDCVIMIRHPQR